MIYEGIDGDHSRWKKLSKSKFEPNLDADLVIGNGRKTYPIHGTGLVVGSGSNGWWSPDLDYVYPITSVDAVSGTEKLVVDVPAVHWADKTRVAGEAVRVRTSYETVTSNSLVESWAPTSLVGNVDESSPYEFAANLSWANSNREPELEIELSTQEIAQTEPQAMIVYLRVDPAVASVLSDGEIASNTTITVSFPRGWAGARWVGLAAPWVDETPTAGHLANTTLVATVRDDPAPSTLFRIEVYAPTTPARPFDIISARLSNGSLGSSNLVVTYPGSVERGLPRVLAPTVPYPVRSDSWAIFGAAFANGGDEVTVKRVDIEIPGGYDALRHGGQGAPLFVGVDNETSHPSSGWTLIDEKHVRWEDPEGVTIDAGKADFWTANLHINPDPRAATSIEPAWSNGPSALLRFSNGFNITSSEWGRNPGTIRFRVPPATDPQVNGEGGSMDGYPWENSALGKVETVTARSDSVLAHLTNTTSYHLKPAGADAVNIEYAAANASLTVSERLVKTGSNLVVRGDLESLMSELGQLGVQSTLTMELYAPPSLGCKPTASWDLPSASLPTAAITDTLLWNAGIPTAGIYAATEDGYAYSLDATGTPIWTFQTAGAPTKLSPMDAGLDGQHLLIGTATGKLQRVRALDGAMAWTVTVSAGQGGYGAKTTVVRFDAQSGRILAATEAGNVILYDTAGVELANFNAQETVLDARISGADVFLLTPTKLHKRSLDLLTGTSVLVDARAFAVSPSYVIVGTLTAALVYDRATLGLPLRVDHPSEARFEAAGDATGDGIDDLVIAHAGSSVTAISGATGARAFTYQITAAGTFPPPYNPLTEFDGTVLDPVSGCTPIQSPAIYGAQLTCSPNTGQGPAFVATGSGASVVAYQHNGRLYLERIGSGGEELGISEDLDIQHAPTAIFTAPWGLNDHAIAYGDKGGRLILYDDQTSPVFTSSPSSRIGHFSFLLHVPQGGFYGTHLVVARLRWQIGVLNAEEARLMDWFDVLDPEGAPVQRPTYSVGLTLGDRGARR